MMKLMSKAFRIQGQWMWGARKEWFDYGANSNDFVKNPLTTGPDNIIHTSFKSLIKRELRARFKN